MLKCRERSTRDIFFKANYLEGILDFSYNTPHGWSPSPKEFLLNQVPILCSTAIFMVLQLVLSYLGFCPNPELTLLNLLSPITQATGNF